MTNPCRSDCPAGDCAGCVFPPRGARAGYVPSNAVAAARVAIMTRCVAATCVQHDRCMRALKPADGTLAVDFSVALAGAPSCRVFVDVRGAALEAAA